MDTQTIEGNKIIAEFMGLYVNTESYNAPVVDLPDDSYCYLHEMEYHSRWDQLMPVVDKCSRLDDKDYSGGMFKVELWMFITNNIGSVCEAVINFIKWQNQPPHPLT